MLSNLRSFFVLAALLVCAALESGCHATSQPEVGGATNWLQSCDSNADCRAAGSCVCGLCSERCTQDDECSAGLTCQSVASALVLNACGPDAITGLCAPPCKTNSDCAAKQTCVEGACAPATRNTTDGGSLDADTVPGRTPHAYVLSALLPDSACVYASGNATLASGTLDIASAGKNSGGETCKHGYRMRLAVASEEPGVLQLSGARVTLMDLDQKVLSFLDADPPLPNPFTYLSSETLLPAAGAETATGIFAVDVMRSTYVPFLATFKDRQILASITLQARDADDAPLTFRPFVFPIDICDGCLTRCLQADVVSKNLTISDVIGDHCADNAGADDRICIDPDC